MTIRISQDVYDAIAARGSFGETPDDVLRRVLNLAPRSAASRQRGRTVRLSDLDDLPLGVAMVRGGRLVVKLKGAPIAMWPLASGSPEAVAEVREEAVAFARAQGAAADIETKIDAALSETDG